MAKKRGRCRISILHMCPPRRTAMEASPAMSTEAESSRYRAKTRAFTPLDCRAVDVRTW